MIDRVVPVRVRGERVLVRVRQQTRGDDGDAGRALLTGPPEALRRLEGYTFAEGGRTVTLAGVRLAPPPDGGEAWLAFAELRATPAAPAGRPDADSVRADSPSGGGPVRSP